MYEKTPTNYYFFRSRKGMQKILLIMKIYVCLAFVMTLQAAATVYSQESELSLEIRNKTVREALKTIESSSDYRFFYNDDFSLLDKKVDLDVRQENIETILKQLLADANVTYKVMADNMVVILPASELQQSKLTGKVTDAVTGEGLPGVTIQVKDTQLGTVTDPSGAYQLVLPEGNPTLIFSYIGYETQEVLVDGRTAIDINMNEALTALDEVVVVGYGTKTKSTVTGSISTVNSDEIENTSAASVASALQGRVSGIYVTAQSGQPGTGSNIYLRGPISISGGKPLYVVDGNPVEDLSYSFNMADIESINVLKDASAAAIYGAKAANGVILVTTKRGTRSKAVVNFSGTYGVRNVINMPKLFARDEYIQAKSLFGYNVTDLYGPQEGWTDLPDTDWLDEWYDKATEQDYTLSVSGGGDISTFYISGNYNRTEGNYLDNWIERYTIRINSDHRITKKLKFTENAYILNGNENPPNTAGNGLLTFRSTPVMAVYDPNNQPGGFAKVPKGFQGSNNVARALTDHTRFKNTVVNLTGSLDYEPIKDLHLNALFGTNLSYVDGYSYQYPYDDGAFAMLETFAESNTKNQSFIATYTLNYKKEIGNHSVTALLGYEARRAEYRYVQYSNRDSYVAEPQSAALAYGVANLSADFRNTDVLDRILSQFGRLDYGYMGKYLLTLNVRRDGYGSKFGPANRYGVFPGMSAGWVISREGFMSEMPYVTLLKLRAGYGVLGNAVGQDFAYTQYYDVQNSYDWSVNGAVKRSTGIDIVSQLANQDIQWESVATTNIGFDASFWNNRLSVNFDYYSRQTKKMLYNVQIAPSAGVGTIVPANIGQMSNKGFEFQIDHRNEFGDFTYFVSFTGGVNKNKLISLDPEIDRLYISSGNIGTGESGQGFYGLVTPCRSEPGLPLGQFYGYQTQGIYSSDADAGTRPTYSGYTPQAGDLIYVDRNGDGKISAPDMTYIGNPWPKFTYGISLGGSWKNLEVRALFNGVYGNEIYNAFESWEHSFFSDYNTTSKIYDASFFGDNGLTSVPRVGTLTKADRNKNWGALSDYHVQSGSYLRLKNVQIGYTISPKLLNKVHISSLKLIAMADNLFVLTKYKGMDPEIPAQANYGGILAQGLDFTSQRYPLSRIMSLGINVTF